MSQHDDDESGLLIDGIDGNLRYLSKLTDDKMRKAALYRIEHAHKKSLAQQFPALFPACSEPKAEPWASDQHAIDALASKASADEAVTCSRLAILHARDAARGFLGRQRGCHEKLAAIRHGDHRDGFTSVADIADDLDTSTPEAMHRRFIVEWTAERLGLELQHDGGDAARFRDFARGKKGDKSLKGLPQFVESLALWWWRNTGRVPEKSRGLRGHSPRRRAPSFIDYVTAAYSDATGVIDPEITRSVTTILQALEKRGAPWSTHNS